MPKIKGKAKAPSSRPSVPAASQAPAQLYSNFLPIPLEIPTSLPIPSSSSKPLTSVIHYLYARPHARKASSDADLPTDRTIFVVNLPVDMGTDALRGVFRTWGHVEKVVMKGQEEDALEQAVLGGLDEESNDSGAEDTEPVDEPLRAAKFVGDLSLPKRKRRNMNRLPESVPSVTPLPPLNPRTDPYGPSGLRGAYVVFLDPSSVTAVMTTPQTITWNPTDLSGYAYYSALHAALRPPLPAVKAFADSSMDRFDHLHSLLLSSRARQKGAGALVDEDGFTVVVRGAGNRTGGIADTKGQMRSVGVAGTKFVKDIKDGKVGKKGKGSEPLQDFYKFQKADRKRQELAELRSKFEEDKKKVEQMRKAKGNRFKPY